ncbi:MAG: hypothetical protein KKA60_00425, partial [Proteobacteria bacterium]|nr:hypothetical protein [Pseudomonadota bacterium]
APEPVKEVIKEEAPAPEPVKEVIKEEAPAPEPVKAVIKKEAPAPEPVKEVIKEEAPAPEPVKEVIKKEAPAPEPVTQAAIEETPPEPIKEAAREVAGAKSAPKVPVQGRRFIRRRLEPAPPPVPGEEVKKEELPVPEPEPLVMAVAEEAPPEAIPEEVKAPEEPAAPVIPVEEAAPEEAETPEPPAPLTVKQPATRKPKAMPPLAQAKILPEARPVPEVSLPLVLPAEPPPPPPEPEPRAVAEDSAEEDLFPRVARLEELAPSPELPMEEPGPAPEEPPAPPKAPAPEPAPLAEFQSPPPEPMEEPVPHDEAAPKALAPPPAPAPASEEESGTSWLHLPGFLTSDEKKPSEEPRPLFQEPAPLLEESLDPDSGETPMEATGEGISLAEAMEALEPSAAEPAGEEEEDEAAAPEASAPALPPPPSKPEPEPEPLPSVPGPDLTSLAPLFARMGFSVMDTGQYFFPRENRPDLALDLGSHPVVVLPQGGRVILTSIGGALSPDQVKAMRTFWGPVGQALIDASAKPRAVFEAILAATGIPLGAKELAVEEDSASLTVQADILFPIQEGRYAAVTWVESEARATQEDIARFLGRKGIEILDVLPSGRIGQPVRLRAGGAPPDVFGRGDAREFAARLMQALEVQYARDVPISFPLGGFTVRTRSNMARNDKGQDFLVDFGTIGGQGAEVLARMGLPLIQVQGGPCLDTARTLARGLAFPTQDDPFFFAADRDRSRSVSIRVSGLLVIREGRTPAMVARGRLPVEIGAFLADRGIRSLSVIQENCP